VFLCGDLSTNAEVHAVESGSLRLTLNDENGAFEAVDKATGVTWGAGVEKRRVGTATLLVEGKTRRVDLARCRVNKDAENGFEAFFSLLPEQPSAVLRV